MEVIDFSEYQTEDGQISLTDRIQATLKYGFSWYSEMEAQKMIINRLGKYLDNKFTIVRNAVLPEVEIPIPLILFGPQGITVIYTDPVKGIFRAKGEMWSVLEGGSRKFKPKKPNLITRTLLMTRAVSVFLSRKNQVFEHVDGVLILSDPGTHVDTVRPAVRIVLSDAIERFASRLGQAPRVVSVEALHQAMDALTETYQPEEEEEDVNLRRSQPFAQSSLATSKPISTLDRKLRKLQRIFNFSKTQWLLLFGLIFIEVLVLISFVIFLFIAQVM